MKNLMRSFCFAVVVLLVKAQTPAEPDYDALLSNFKFPLDNYRPLLDQVQVATLYPENVDLATVSVRSLTFPAQETVCTNLDGSTEGEQGEQCQLKENGKTMHCSGSVAYTTQMPTDIRGFELSCEMAKKEAVLKRVRRGFWKKLRNSVKKRLRELGERGISVSIPFQ